MAVHFLHNFSAQAPSSCPMKRDHNLLSLLSENQHFNTSIDGAHLSDDVFPAPCLSGIVFLKTWPVKSRSTILKGTSPCASIAFSQALDKSEHLQLFFSRPFFCVPEFPIVVIQTGCQRLFLLLYFFQLHV